MFIKFGCGKNRWDAAAKKVHVLFSMQCEKIVKGRGSAQLIALGIVIRLRRKRGQIFGKW